MKKLFTILLLVFVININAQSLQEMRGVWLTNVDSPVLFTDKSIADAMDYLASIGVNVVFPVVWNKGYTLFPSRIMDSLFNVPLWQNLNGRDVLDRVVIEAHRNGIEVIPWFEFGFSSSYSLNGGHIIAAKPHWAGKNNQGNLLVKNGFDWMAATNPEVQNFMIELIKEAVDNYDVDGIQGDDRLPAMPVEGGYDSVTVEIYKSENNGNTPPSNFADSNWKRWRANKLNTFLRNLKDTVKQRSEHLIISTSPSVFPWGYDEYLQDSKSWVDSGITENFIPQLYRQNISSYTNELNLSLSRINSNKHNIFFAGVLAKVGSYVMNPDLLIGTIQANRERNVKGEVFFFYEGLRANNNLLGDTLKALFYNQPALLPYRNGNIWRPKAEIVNEDDAGAFLIGNWSQQNVLGFKPKVYWSNDTNYASITYNFDVPFDAWFSVYVYMVSNFIFANNAPYTLIGANDSLNIIMNQRDPKNNGWQKLGDIYLTAGNKPVIRLDNINIESGKYILADAAMIKINRKLSPDVIVTSVKNELNINEKTIPSEFRLEQNYPNPFNPSTKIEYIIASDPDKSGKQSVSLKVYDILGREVTTLINEFQKPGIYNVSFDGSNLSSGIYYYRLVTGSYSETKKMLLLK